MVKERTTPPLYLGIDLGGSMVRASIIDAAGRVVESSRRELPESAEARRGEPARLAGSYRGRVAAVGLAVAGTVRDGTMTWSANLGLSDVPFQPLLEAAAGAPAVVLNDARAAGLAEATLGAGARHDLVLVLTLGTGVGGALVHRGRLVEGAGDAGEVGHMRVEPGGVLCGCGEHGCWETYVGGRALARLCTQLVGELSPDPVGTAVKLAECGDPAAVELFAEAATRFRRGVDSLCAVLSPDVVILGGGMMARRGYVARTYRAALGGLRWGSATEILASRLGDDAGQVGAALHAAARVRQVTR